MHEKNYRVPSTDGHYDMVKEYVPIDPEAPYVHASEQAMDAFRDIKYAVRVHWGLYSIKNYNGESWAFLEMSHAEKHEYIEQYKQFDPQRFDAEAWMEFFKKCGFQAFAFTTKHHDGFSMYDTAARVKQRINWQANPPCIEDCDQAFSVMESPFGRDIVKELCEEAHKHDLKINLYYSHPDWYDADFRPYVYHPMVTPEVEEQLSPIEHFYYLKERSRRDIVIGPSKTPEQTERMMKRHRDQLVEIITKYGKIDMVCLDMWFARDVWPQLKKTLEELRRLDPDIMLRARGIGNYGDYYTPEGFVPGAKENTDLPWMVIYPLGSSFSYDADGTKYKGARWILDSLIGSICKGGSFMVAVGPDKDGQFHPEAVRQLEEAGEWVERNAEAIYGTVAREGSLYCEFDSRFTVSKDGKTLYAFLGYWPEAGYYIRSAAPKAGTKVTMSGCDCAFDWSPVESGGFKIQVPNKPCCGEQAFYVFKIEL